MTTSEQFDSGAFFGQPGAMAKEVQQMVDLE